MNGKVGEGCVFIGLFVSRLIARILDQVLVDVDL